MTGAHTGGLATLSWVLDSIVAAGTRDAGTCVLNKRSWRDRATDALAAQGRRGRTSGLLLIDIDDYKQINDRAGHSAGDTVLTAVVEAIQSEVRQVDVVGRIGGDEFAVLLSGDQSAPSITAVGDRVRARVAGLGLDTDLLDTGASVGPVTVSVGAAVIVPSASADTVPNDRAWNDRAPGDPARGDIAWTGTALAAAVRSADRALYLAKNAGRDTVCLAPSPVVSPVVSPRPAVGESGGESP